MSYRNERFNRSFRSLGDAPHSDRNRSVDLLVEAIDFDGAAYAQNERERVRDYELQLDILIALLILSGREHLVPTLRLIVKHGKFESESVAEMVGSKRGKKAKESAERRYRQHRQELLEIV